MARDDIQQPGPWRQSLETPSVPATGWRAFLRGTIDRLRSASHETSYTWWPFASSLQRHCGWRESASVRYWTNRVDVVAIHQLDARRLQCRCLSPGVQGQREQQPGAESGKCLFSYAHD